jgi:hypothetical protein
MYEYGNGFAFQYAIRLPNGSLFHKTRPQSMMMSVFAEPQPERELAVFDDRAEAEKLLDDMRMLGAQLGVDNLGAAIVQRLCSPFTEDYTAPQFVAAIAEWMEGQA